MRRHLRILALLLAAVMLFSTGCEKTAIDAKYGDVRRSFNDLEIPELSVTPNNAPAGFGLILEAEDAELTGSARVSGSYVNGMNQDGDSITFTVYVENSGFYDLNFISKGSTNRVNNVSVDGYRVADITPTSEADFNDSYARYIYLSAGEHEVKLTPSWGYVDFDKLVVTANEFDAEKVYKVTAPLTNPNADEHTQMLYKFLCDIYGKYSLTGQYADKGRESNEYKAILDATGESFAVLGLDMNNYTPIATRNGSESNAVEYAHDWYYNAGGIVQFCWHWCLTPTYIVDGRQWWESFRAEAVNLDLNAAMNGDDEKAYDRLMKDIDAIAEQLKRLQEDGVPVLWRPLHEAAGGWFWWGSNGSDAYIKLWRAMYDKLTYEHGLTNLIWVWNGQDPDWYPGDDVVDIVAWDIYPGNREYGSFSSTFAKCVESYGETKLVALSENGCIMDPDLTYRDNSRWLFWGIWSGEFAVRGDGSLSEYYTEREMLKKAYESEYTLTLDELPNLRKYPLN